MYWKAFNSASQYASELYGAQTTWGIAFGTQMPTKTKTASIEEPLTFKRLHLKDTPLETFCKLYKKHETSYLLESIEGPKKLAQFSFVGFGPAVTIQAKNGVAITKNEESGEERTEVVRDPLFILKSLAGGRTTPNKDFRMAGGAVGYISYDAVRYWEKLPNKARDNLDFPDAEFGIYDDGIVFDHRQRRVYYYYYSENRLAEIQRLLSRPIEEDELIIGQPKAIITQARYEEAVKKLKNYICKGDIFQAVLSKRFDFSIDGDLTRFYRALRAINPSPYMYFLKSGNRQIVGSSPEMLMRTENRTIETFPIAGTRPVTASSAENRRLARELLGDPKERAEHVMLVDLARNDIGRVSRFGSVRVPEFMRVQRYSHVQHIVSRVVGDLREGLDSYDALRSVFPAGTVSGAPKVRAMEIIDELELMRRGPYAGAVGYFSYNGNSDFAITIRTLFADKNGAHIQVGAGIVADSVPENEWLETEHKANALLTALQNSGGEKKSE
jgi:anthranilate synthase component 1